MKKFLLSAASCVLLIAFFSGCATVSTRDNLTTYYVNGANYVSLVSLCNVKGISLDYDTFSRTATLVRGGHKISLMVGDRLVLVDGNKEYLRHPVTLYENMLVVPYKFKEQVIDALFKDAAYEVKSAGYLSRIKRVVVDAGHGGKDPGAIGRTGVKEKDVTLDIAKRLESILKREGIDVVMTRSTDKFISLTRRAEIANRAHADLFISIHANANRVRSLKGFEIYYVSNSVSDITRAIEAAGEAAPDVEPGSLASNSTNLKAILWDMIYTDSRAQSLKLGRSICRSVDDNIEDSRVIGVKEARFYVLKGTRMPAILIEVGFLSNYSEECLLRNVYFRQKMAETIAQGIDNFARDCILAEVR